MAHFSNGTLLWRIPICLILLLIPRNVAFSPKQNPSHARSNSSKRNYVSVAAPVDICAPPQPKQVVVKKSKFTLTERILNVKPGQMNNAAVQSALSAMWYHVKESRHPNASDQALRLLERLLQEKEESNTQHMTVLTAGHVINVLSACRRNSVESGTLARLSRVLRMLRHSNIWDDAMLCYFVGALAKCKNKDAPQCAESVLKKMQELHVAGVRGVAPNERHFGAVLSSYAKRGNIREAELLLERMDNLHESGYLKHGATKITYSAVLNGLAKSNDRDGPERANALVRKMEEMHENGHPDIKPDIITYTSLLNCYATQGKAKDSEELLQKVQGLYEAGYLQKGPDTIFYTTVLNAIIKSGATDALNRARTLVRHMDYMATKGHHELRPNSVTYSLLSKLTKIRSRQ